MKSRPSRSKATAKTRRKTPAAVAIAPSPFPPGQPVPLPAGFTARLSGLIRKHLALTVGEGIALLALAAGGLLVIQAALDWLIDLPWAGRALLLLADVVLLCRLAWIGPVRAWKKRLNLETAALLTQKKWPATQGSLVAAVQLAAARPGSPQGSPRLIAVLLERVGKEAARIDFNAAFSARPFWKKTGLCLLLWLALGTIVFLAPHGSTVLLERIFLSNVPLPTRTVVVPITGDLQILLGADAVLEAKADGVVPPTGRVTLTYQGGEKQELVAAPQQGKPGTFSLTLHNVQRAFHYRFYLNDGHGESYSVRTRIAPTIQAIEAEEAPAAYTGLPSRKAALGDLSLLAGSALRIHIQTTLPLSHAFVVEQGVGGKIEMKVGGDDRKSAGAELPIPAKDLTGFSVHLVSQDGLDSSDDVSHPLRIVPDAPPAINLLSPTNAEETLTLKAKPPIVFTVADDYGLQKIEIHYEIGAPAPTARDEVPPPVAQKPIPIALDFGKGGFVPGTLVSLTYAWDVATQTPPWHEGDTVNYWIEATDNNTATGPGVTASKKQHFVVVSPQVKQAEALQSLEKNVQQMREMMDAQKDVAKKVEDALKQKTP